MNNKQYTISEIKERFTNLSVVILEKSRGREVQVEPPAPCLLHSPEIVGEQEHAVLWYKRVASSILGEVSIGATHVQQ
jgi:hypothetical protein